MTSLLLLPGAQVLIGMFQAMRAATLLERSGADHVDNTIITDWRQFCCKTVKKMVFCAPYQNKLQWKKPAYLTSKAQ